jgi:glycosyltransferase involved in cell wall biosynthesis
MLLVHEIYGSLAVIITCHKYEHFLPEAINSVLSQGVTLEIIVVDDMPGSHPTACEKVLQQYPNVKRIETHHGDPLKARQAGFEACDSEYVCFLDADDKLGEGYIEEALRLLTVADVIYSDIQYFGTEDRRTDFPDNINAGRIAIGNFLHVGCVTKRGVINAAHAFDHPPLTDYHEDWYFWRKILSAGFSIRKQTNLYHARQHEHNKSTPLKELDYYQTRGTAGDTITLCGLGEAELDQNWPNAYKQDFPPHIRSRLDKINHALRTAWTDFIFFYGVSFQHPDICERLLRKMNSQVAIAHNTDFNFLDCTIVAVPMVRGRVLTTEDELKQLRIIYV